MIRGIGGCALAAVAAVGLAACGSSTSTGTTTAAAAAATRPVSATPSGLTIATAKGPMGAYLVGASGRALYLWVADSAGRSNCSGECAKAWPPVLAKATPHAAGGVNAADLSTVTRSDGGVQVTYKGHPLYYFVADTAAGMTRGQGNDGFGAKWWLVAPSGSAITTAGAGSSTGSTGSTGSSGSSGSTGTTAGGGWG